MKTSRTRAARTAGIDLGPEDAFDAVALMNVLDRCDEPFTLLADLRKLVKPVTGRLVLAVVIPFRPFVEAWARFPTLAPGDGDVS